MAKVSARSGNPRDVTNVFRDFPNESSRWFQRDIENKRFARGGSGGSLLDRRQENSEIDKICQVEAAAFLSVSSFTVSFGLSYYPENDGSAGSTDPVARAIGKLLHTAPRDDSPRVIIIYFSLYSLVSDRHRLRFLVFSRHTTLLFVFGFDTRATRPISLTKETLRAVLCGGIAPH